MTNANDNAYWDALPFQGYHYPAHLRIQDGKFKSPNHGGQVTTLPDGLTDKQISYRESQGEAKRIREVKEAAKREAMLKRLATEKAASEAYRDAKSRKRLEELKAKEEKKRLARESDDRIHAEKVVAWEADRLRKLAPKPVKEPKPRKTPVIKTGAKGSAKCRVTLTKDGETKTLESIHLASKYLEVAASSVRQAGLRVGLCKGWKVVIEYPDGERRAKVPKVRKPSVKDPVPIRVTYPDGHSVVCAHSGIAATLLGVTRASIRNAAKNGWICRGCKIERA